MKAVRWTGYGAPEVLILDKFNKPTPKDDEVLIKIYASTVTAGDVRLRATKVSMGFWLPTRLAFGLTKPRKQIPGMELSGEIEAIGKNVTLFNKGDTVYGTTGMALGAHAEFVCLSESSNIVRKPNNITHEQAVGVVFGGLTALHFLGEKVKVTKGQKVLINGASGAVGTASVQLAHYYGAEVMGICSTKNIKLVQSLGAKNVIDYTREDFTSRIGNYDVILDAVGNLSLAQCSGLLTENGKLILINAGLFTNLSSLVRKNLICGVAGESKEALNFLKERIGAYDIKVVVDKVYPLDKIVEAHRYVDLGHKKGSVVIAVTHDDA